MGDALPTYGTQATESRGTQQANSNSPSQPSQLADEAMHPNLRAAQLRAADRHQRNVNLTQVPVDDLSAMLEITEDTVTKQLRDR